MKYTEPNMEIFELKQVDIIRTSGDDGLIVFPGGDDGSGQFGGL